MNFFDKIKNVKIKEPTPQDVDTANSQSTDFVQEENSQVSQTVIHSELDQSCSTEQNSAATTSIATSIIELNSPMANTKNLSLNKR